MDDCTDKDAPPATSEPRTGLGWTVGILVWVMSSMALYVLGNVIGVPTQIELDEPVTVHHGSGIASYETEEDTLTTQFGQYGGVFSLVVAIWAGPATAMRTWTAAWNRNQRRQFFAWLWGTGILLVLSISIALVFALYEGRLAILLRVLVHAGAVAGVASLAYRWYRAGSSKDHSTRLEERPASGAP